MLQISIIKPFFDQTDKSRAAKVTWNCTRGKSSANLWRAESWGLSFCYIFLWFCVSCVCILLPKEAVPKFHMQMHTGEGRRPETYRKKYKFLQHFPLILRFLCVYSAAECWGLSPRTSHALEIGIEGPFSRLSRKKTRVWIRPNK